MQLSATHHPPSSSQEPCLPSVLLEAQCLAQFLPPSILAVHLLHPCAHIYPMHTQHLHLSVMLTAPSCYWLLFLDIFLHFTMSSLAKELTPWCPRRLDP